MSKKTKYVQVTFTEEQYDLLKQDAERAKRSIPSYIRYCIGICRAANRRFINERNKK